MLCRRFTSAHPSSAALLWFGAVLAPGAFASSPPEPLSQDSSDPLAMDRADEPVELDPEQLEFFEARIRPVLVDRCYECHSTTGPRVRGGLLLDSRAGARMGGDFGPAVVPGDLEASLLWGAINHDDIAMPPRERLPDDVIEDFRRWILMGAPDPRTSVVEPTRATVTEADIEAGRSWWSLQPPQRGTVPQLAEDDWSRTDIDRFVFARLDEAGLAPAADAASRTLLRRLSTDLIGLPPTPAELDAFELSFADDPEQALAEAVARLLEDPGYGERWGRHWLDVARYAESSGRELNVVFEEAWRYRDWVLDAVQRDLPYDAFVRAQLAGDLLPADTDEEWAANLVATGFLSLGTKPLRERSARQFQVDLVDEQIDTTTRALLGTSVACARCHDHKFEPIQQQDYTALAGIFESTETYFGTAGVVQSRRATSLLELPVADPSDDVPTRDPRVLARQRAELASLTAERDALRRELRRQRQREALGGSLGSMESWDRNEDSMEDSMADTAMGSAPSGSSPVTDAGDGRRQYIRAAGRVARLEADLALYDEDGARRSFCMGVQDADRPRDARLLVRGEIEQAGERVPRGLPQVFDDPERPFEVPRGASGRLQLADWIASPDNPLTARVFVNRVWLHLFGAGLVTTPEDFGRTGAAPSHPELLDHLALEFVESGWSLKQLITAIVTSRVYRQSSAYRAEAFALDPENALLWRAPSRRLDAEALRDGMLAVAGTLDRERPRGSDIARLGTRSLTRVGPEDLDRGATYRSVYVGVARDLLPHGLEVFDLGAADRVIGQREVTSTPTQALYLRNNAFVVAQSRAFARRVREEAEGRRDQVRRAFLLAFGREPEADELSACVEFVRDLQASLRDRDASSPGLEALSSLCQVLFASAEFRYLD